MKHTLLLALVLAFCVSCASKKNNYTKVNVSKSESAALSALSNLSKSGTKPTNDQDISGSSATGISLKANGLKR
ncbi:MAG: hypothetical protein ACO3K7_01680 [Candidatus Marinamargulisbacteria bacterium]